MKRILGIDPGFQGGLVMLKDGVIETLLVMPTYSVTKKKTRKIRKNEDNPKNAKTKTYNAKVNNLDIGALNQYFRGVVNPVSVHVFLERVNPRPGEGLSSVGRFAEQFGIIQGLLVANNLNYTIVSPNQWTKKMHLGVPKTISDAKERSLVAVKRFFPNVDFMIKGRRKPHDGLIDAALIALYGKGELL